jgi:hypothetical protein
METGTTSYGRAQVDYSNSIKCLRKRPKVVERPSEPRHGLLWHGAVYTYLYGPIEWPNNIRWQPTAANAILGRRG